MQSDVVPIGQLWKSIQHELFPELEETLGSLTDKEKQFIRVCELCAESLRKEIGQYEWQGLGRPSAERLAVAKAFIAKAVYAQTTTKALIEYLHGAPTLRRLCGWEREDEIPSEATFSRCFGEFAQVKLSEKIHESVVKAHEGARLIGHVSRDATAIEAREHAVKKEEPAGPVEEKPAPKRGRPRAGETREPKAEKRLERQVRQILEENLSELPQVCDWGCKRDSNGKRIMWKGFKLHLDVADGDIPISAVLTSASLHDSQAAIPLAQMSATRATNLYDLMDAAYDAQEIRQYSTRLGHVAIIDRNARGGDAVPMAPAEARRYNERSGAERVFSHLEHYGAYAIYVRGTAKVMCHLMFAVLALTVHQLYQLII